MRGIVLATVMLPVHPDSYLRTVFSVLMCHRNKMRDNIKFATVWGLL